MLALLWGMSMKGWWWCKTLEGRRGTRCSADFGICVEGLGNGALMGCSG